MGRKRDAFIATCALGLSLSGCVLDADPETVRQTGQAVLGGAATSSHPAVVAVLVDGGSMCSGFLVSPKIVLTAASCFAQEAPVETVEVIIGDSFADNKVTAVEHRVHPGFVLENPETVNDLAMVLLPEASTAAPLAIARQTLTSDLEGQSATIVGFGYTSSQGYDSGTKRAVEGSISVLLDLFVSIESQNANYCLGDAGGPLIVSMNGTPTVIATGSSGTEDCNWSMATRLDQYAADFIDPWIAEKDPQTPACGAADGACDASCEDIDPDCDDGQPADDVDDDQDGPADDLGDGTVVGSCAVGGGANDAGVLVLVLGLLAGWRRRGQDATRRR